MSFCYLNHMRLRMQTLVSNVNTLHFISLPSTHHLPIMLNSLKKYRIQAAITFSIAK